MRISPNFLGTFRMVALSLGIVLTVGILSVSKVYAGGTLYLIDGDDFYTVDPATADVNRIGLGLSDGLAPSEMSSILYATDTAPSLYRLPVDGSSEIFIATIGGDADRGLAFNTHTGVLYGTDNSIFGSIDRVTGAFTQLATPPSEPEALAADPNNNLVYGLATSENPNLMVYNVSTGLWSIVGPTTVADGGKAGLAFDPVAGILYASDRDANGNLYSIDPTNAATMWIGSLGLSGSGTGLAFVPDLIFSDGFESGDTTLWSGSTP